MASRATIAVKIQTQCCIPLSTGFVNSAKTKPDVVIFTLGMYPMAVPPIQANNNSQILLLKLLSSVIIFLNPVFCYKLTSNGTNRE